MNIRRGVATLPIIFLVAPTAAQQRGQMTAEERARRQAAAQAAFEAEIVMENPIPTLNSVWIEELTWIEIRDAMAAGKKTVIIPTGGIEQNGPYVATGKHNYVLRGTCEGIARELGDALCAPIIKLVPEGSIDPPSGHMRYPGTLSVREETFEAMLEDVGRSLRVHGFEHIIYIGDSGGNQRGMQNVAERLNQEWGHPVAHYIPEYYDNEGLVAYMENELGIQEGPSDGYHDFFWLTAMQATVDPETVRYNQRVQVGKASINGRSIAPLERTLEVGRALMGYRVESTAAAVRAAIARAASSQH